MKRDTVFFRQAELVLRVLPLINQEEVFALKGGTAINFFLSVKEGEPQWELLGVPGIENLPAVQWKLQNKRRMTPAKHREALRILLDYLGV